MTNGSRVGWHVWKNQYQRHKLRDSLMANRSHRLLSSLLREWHWACYTDFDACDALNFLTPVDRHLVPRDYSGLPETWRCQTLSQGPLLTSTVWQLRLLQNTEITLSCTPRKGVGGTLSGLLRNLWWQLMIHRASSHRLSKAAPRAVLRLICFALVVQESLKCTVINFHIQTCTEYWF